MMKLYSVITVVLVGSISWADEPQEVLHKRVPANPAIDMPAHLKLAMETAKYREERRVTEDDFLRMSREPGTIILDTRSKERFDQLHVKGAVHLNFSDLTEEGLAKVIPEKTTRVLIYCNNNFKNGGPAFILKQPALALNLPTFITLYGYGYKNIYELGPQIDPKATTLEFESKTKAE